MQSRNSNRRLPNKKPEPNQVGESKANQAVKRARKALRQTQVVDDTSKGIIKALSLPKESEPLRLGTQFGSDPTAACRIFDRFNIINGTQALATDIPNADTIGFAFRDPLRASVNSYGLLATDVAQYKVPFEVELTTSPASVYPTYTDQMIVQPASNIQPHGLSLFFGRLNLADPSRGILCTRNSTLTVQVTNSGGLPPLAVVNCDIMLLDGATWVAAETIPYDPLVGLFTNFVVPATGYYCVRFAVIAAPTAGVAQQFVGYVTSTTLGATVNTMWAQKALSGIDDVITTIQSARISGFSLMLTNTASPLNRQGQVVGLQVPKGTDFLNYIDFDTVAKLNKSETLNVVNGMYGFAKPTETEDLDMMVFQYEPTNVPGAIDYVFPIIPMADYLLIHSQVVDPNGRQGYWTTAHLIEYTTTTQFAELRTAVISTTALEHAFSLLSRLPQWHENDLHISDIWNWIKDTASDIWGGVRDVANVAAPLLPIAAAFL